MRAPPARRPTMNPPQPPSRGRLHFQLGALLATLLAAMPPVAPPAVAAAPPGSPPPFSPAVLVADAEGSTLHVGGRDTPGILTVEVGSARVTRRLPTSLPVSGLALSPGGQRLYATCAGPSSQVLIVDATLGKVLERFPTGHTAMSPVLSPDGNTLFVCLRFEDAIALLDPITGKERQRIKVRREPVSAALTADGRHLLVANHLHDGRADVAEVAAVVSVIDVAAARVVKELRLPNGSGALNEIRISPDGRFAAVTHILARFHLPTTQLERGWMNTNAETLIDLGTLEILNTVLLDSVDAGAAVPWGVAWTRDGRHQIVVHSGTHDVSIIDFPALLDRLAQLPEKADPAKPAPSYAASRIRADVPNDLSFLVGLRKRVRLPEGDRGPRAVALAGTRFVTANFFSDTLSVIEPATDPVTRVSLSLGPKPVPTQERLGEEYFHDATICFQGWQSCATCHPGDARVDALNWDNLNDDIGNPKNNKSLLLAHRTPPSMSLGVRDSAEVSVRAGIRHILFTVQPDSVATAMDAYLKALKPVPSPHLENGRLSPSARRGRRLFESSRVGCATCHPAGLYTDQKHYDVGTRAATDAPADIFDTPTLIEIWRTAPYLHDGSAATLHELFTTRNVEDRHGRTSHLKPDQIDDLVAYLLSL